MIFPHIPYPLRANGISIRYFPLIQHLSHNCVIDIIAKGDWNTDSMKIEALRSYCRRVFIIQNQNFSKHNLIQKIATQVNILLPWTPPNSFTVYDEKSIKRMISEATEGIEYDTLVCVGGYCSPYLRSICANRVVIDFVDSPTLHAKREVVGSLKSPLLQKYEYWKIRGWEAKLIQNSAASIYISPVDAKTLPLKMTKECTRHVIPNGIFVDDYNYSRHKEISSPNIGFLGNMGYPPNIEAVHWLYDQVFLPLRTEVPDLSLYIIGRDPVDSILALRRKPGVFVTGVVEDIWPYLNAIDVFIYPLWKGAGLKNKILESMYAKRPVLTTRIGNEGIEALPGRDLLVCNTSAQFCQEALRLLFSSSRRASIGESGHKFAVKNFSWGQILRRFEEVIIG